MRMVKEEAKSKGTNPYNANKEWGEEGKTGKEFVSADDSMAVVNKKKYAILDKMEDKQEEEVVEENDEGREPEGEEAKPYQRVDYKKRYDDLKKHYDRKVNAWKEEEKELKRQARESAPKYTPPTSEEELAKFKEDNPELFNVVETVAHMRSTQQLKDLQDELKEVRENLHKEEANRALAELKALVPDFWEIRQSDDFHEWAEEQPKEIQDWVYRNSTNVQLAARAINLYKADRNIGQKQPKAETKSDNRGTADQAVRVRSQREEPQSREKIWTRSEINGLSLPQYEKYKDEIDLAFQEGRIRDE